jgi:tetratricopeptide (TPR) repeat protein
MKIKCAMLLSILLLSGCASLQVGSDVAAGRRAMLNGNNEAALAYFHKAAIVDPEYRHGTAYQQGIWSYVGRSEYALGRLPQARNTLEKALTMNRDEDLARLYLGLALARSGDRDRGLKEIESGIKGIHDWLDYINEAHRFSFGQFWDPAHAIRAEIQGDLAMISTRDIDWQRLVASAERIGQLMEAEGDKARRDEARERARDSGGKDSPR